MDGEEEPDDATGSRKVVVGKVACNILMAIQLLLVVLSNCATDSITHNSGPEAPRLGAVSAEVPVRASDYNIMNVIQGFIVRQ